MRHLFTLQTFLFFTLASVNSTEALGVVNGTPVSAKDIISFKELSAIVAVHGPGGKLCTGVVLSTKAVLTAAHCLGSAPLAADIYVEISATEVTKARPSPLAFRVAKVQLASDADQLSQPTPADDIGLLFTEDDLGIMPVKIPEEFEGFFSSQEFKSAGFGRSHDQEDGLPNGLGRLRKTSFQSSELIGGKPGADQSLVFDANRVGLCSGDSGAPLFASQEGSSSAYLVGVAKAVEPRIPPELESDFRQAKAAGLIKDFFTNNAHVRMCSGRTKFISLESKTAWIRSKI